MQYAVAYHPRFRYFFDVDEVIFDLNDLDDKFYDTVSNHLPKTTIGVVINAEITDNLIFYQINKIHNDFPDKEIIIYLNWLHVTDEELDIVKAEGYKYIFNSPATKLSEVAAMVYRGASEVIIAEDLGFNLKLLQPIRQSGVKIRIYPDVAQIATRCRKLPSLTRFFVRPEDLPLYEDLIDTVEFWARDDRLSVVYEIYKQQQWKGLLNLVIKDLDDIDIDNTGITPYFGKARLSCKKRCAYSDCDICSVTESLAKSFEEAEVGIIKNKVPFEKASPQEKEKLKEMYLDKEKA